MFELPEAGSLSSFMPGTGGGVDDGSGYSYLLNTKIAAFCNWSEVKPLAGFLQKGQWAPFLASTKALNRCPSWSLFWLRRRRRPDAVGN